MTELMGMATGHISAKVAMIEFGEEQLDMWEACGAQVVVLEGGHIRHLMDLGWQQSVSVWRGEGRSRQGLGLCQQEVQGGGCAGDLGVGEHVE